mgnify:FL=1
MTYLKFVSACSTITNKRPLTAILFIGAISAVEHTVTLVIAVQTLATSTREQSFTVTRTF